MAPTLARTASSEADYARLKIKHRQIMPWEDGMRTDGGKGSYEWWYFDSHLADGSSLVIVFFTKNVVNPEGLLAPSVTVEFERPGQGKIQWEIRVPVHDFRASKDGCDVKIGRNYFRGDLHRYEIHVEHEGDSFDVELVGQVPAWRPETGHFYFGAQDDYYFAWLPSVPQGNVQVTATAGGDRLRLGGIGYHDHNWGNAAMVKLINHWYWGRAQAGPYTVVASWITAEKSYGSIEIPIILLAKGDELIADDANKLSLELTDEMVDEQSGKPFAGNVVYTYTDGDTRYRISYVYDRIIDAELLIDQISGIKHLLAKLSGFDGAYLRFTGNVTLEKFVGNKKVETNTDPGIWELMYFGHVS